MHRLTLELTQQIVWTVEADGSGLIMSERYRELTGIDRRRGRRAIDPSRRPRRWSRPAGPQALAVRHARSTSNAGFG